LKQGKAVRVMVRNEAALAQAWRATWVRRSLDGTLLLSTSESLYFAVRLDSMFQILMVSLGHLLILSLALFGLFFLRRYILARFVRLNVHCPTQLAAKGQYEAPPRGWNLCFLIIQLAGSSDYLAAAFAIRGPQPINI
jgi:hypothetical protein